MSTPHGSTPSGNEHTESAISAGMASGDTDAVMRAVANSDIVVPQATVAPGEEAPDGSLSLPVIEQDGTSYVPVFTSEETMNSAAPELERRGRRLGRRAGRQLALRRPLAGGQPRHRGRPHPSAGRRAVAAGLHRAEGLTADSPCGRLTAW